MTEPQHITMARQVLAQEGIDREGELYRNAATLIDQHESYTKRTENAKALAEKSLADAIADTDRRWPSIARAGFVFRPKTDREYDRIHKRRGEHEELSYEMGDICFEGDEESQSRDAELVVALLDATNNNTTANKLREAIRVALLVHGERSDDQTEAGFDEVKAVLNSALESETWNR